MNKPGSMFVNYKNGQIQYDDGQKIQTVPLLKRMGQVSATEFDLYPDTGDDVTDILNNINNVAKENFEIIIEPGTYVISDQVRFGNKSVTAYGVTFDLQSNTPTTTFSPGVPENHDGSGYLSITTREAGTLTNKAAVVFGPDSDGNDRPLLNYLRGLTITRTAADNTAGSRLYAGILFLAPFHCEVTDMLVQNFNCGYLFMGGTSSGCVHNTLRNLRQNNCRYGYTLYTAGTGWVNQNSFHQGRHLITSAIRTDDEWDGGATPANGHYGWEWEFIRLLWQSSATFNPPNNNSFYDVTLENEVGRKVRCEGADNIFAGCRYETIRAHTPFYDITIGEASRLGTFFARNNFIAGKDLEKIVAENQLEFIASGGAQNIGNMFLTGGVSRMFGVAGTTEKTSWIFGNGNSVDPVLSIANASNQQVMKDYHVYSALSAQGARTFLDTGGTVRNGLGMNTASPYDLQTIAGMNIGNVFRVRVSGTDVLVANPGGGNYICNVGGGVWRFYSGSSSNNDVLTVADSSQSRRLVLKAAAAAGDWGAGHYGVFEFYNATPAKENAIMLGSTAFGSTRPIAIYGPVWFNKGATASFGRYRGSGVTSLMEWDCVNDRVGVNTTAPDTLWHVNGAGHVGGDLEIDGALNHDGSNVGFRGVAPVAISSAYTPTNVTTDRTYDANSTSIDELADVLGTLIADLQAQGLIG